MTVHLHRSTFSLVWPWSPQTRQKKCSTVRTYMLGARYVTVELHDIITFDSCSA